MVFQKIVGLLTADHAYLDLNLLLIKKKYKIKKKVFAVGVFYVMLLKII